MLDLIIAGAGPAGSMAALVAARAGARVLLVDRETFPRDKLCGDTLNPGAIGLLRSLDLAGGPLTSARPLAGMLLSGPSASVETRYSGGRCGVALRRRVFDAWLLEQAITAGARFEPGLVVRAPLVEDAAGSPRVRGLVLARGGTAGPLLRIPASMTIAADGRRSVVARALGLAAHPPRARRWAFGAYAIGVRGVTDLGEMHIRPGRYLGIAPLDDAVCNVCVVTGPRPGGSSPLEVIRRAIERTPAMRERFAGAEFLPPVRVLGPLAVDARTAGADGLLLAGDAAGFVDPMTGDGLHLAMRGAVLASRAALAALETGDLRGAARRLWTLRRDEIASKERFNRAVRRLVDSRAALSAASWGARIAPQVVRWAVRYAGDAA